MATKGETIVRTSFNASGSGHVDKIKNHAAAAIDMLDQIPEPVSGDGSDQFHRLKALATTHFEIAAMFAVKAATCGK